MHILTDPDDMLIGVHKPKRRDRADDDVLDAIIDGDDEQLTEITGRERRPWLNRGSDRWPQS